MPSDSDKPIVLIVDDDPALRDGLSALLTDGGYRVAAFPTGAAALVYARCRDQPPAASAVVVVHLPDTDGVTLSRQLQEHLGPAAPIIVLSGDTSMRTLDALRGAGATYFFSKCVHVERLHELLAERLPPATAAASSSRPTSATC
ncbi:MAG: two component transcriptional regulator, LuxR family [Phycisphaerales bacterium]|nr:two component transcriptional regulator, LuxR family [Phycisphaerales bacterium]